MDADFLTHDTKYAFSKIHKQSRFLRVMSPLFSGKIHLTNIAIMGDKLLLFFATNFFKTLRMVSVNCQ